MRSHASRNALGWDNTLERALRDRIRAYRIIDGQAALYYAMLAVQGMPESFGLRHMLIRSSTQGSGDLQSTRPVVSWQITRISSLPRLPVLPRPWQGKDELLRHSSTARAPWSLMTIAKRHRSR